MTVTDQKLVIGAQSAEAKLDGGASEVVPPQKPEIRSEIIPLHSLPCGRLVTILPMPVVEFPEGLAIIALSVC